MTAHDPSVLIVGGGAAGHACAQTLRKRGFDGAITIVDGEGGPAINRTLVDKAVLPGVLTGLQIALPPVPDVEVIAGSVTSFDSRHGAVSLDGGRELRADAVVLACGSRPRGIVSSLRVDAGVTVHQIHTAADAERLREVLPEPAGARIVLLGAGFIGTEVASHYTAAGAEVVLLGRSARPLRAAVGARIADRLAALHREHVDARFGVTVQSISAGAREGTAVITLADGSTIEADAVIAALGTTPATGWVGMPNGIAADASLRASDFAPGTYAAGSATLVDVGSGSRMRIDHWDAAVAQGTHAARTLLHDLAGAEEPETYVPKTGFNLTAYGQVIASRGVNLPDGGEHIGDERVAGSGGLVTEFRGRDGLLTGVAGLNAGAAVMKAASEFRAYAPAI